MAANPAWPMEFDDTVVVARNRHGYTFAVGLLEGLWAGFAVGGGGLFFFPGISADHRIGVPDRHEAIRMVGACAQDVGAGFGGIDDWCVPEDLRGDPERYRCGVCDEVCCGDEHDQAEARYHDEDD